MPIVYRKTPGARAAADRLWSATRTAAGSRSWPVLVRVSGGRAHAQLAHVAERHRLDRLVEAGHFSLSHAAQ
jgi:hypothetical protein